MKWLTVLCAVWLAACGGIPKDPEGTLERVRADGRFRVGIIASGGTRTASDRECAFLDQVAKASGAKAVSVQDAAEPLLEDLEHGRVDLVIGELASDSPWAQRVTILPPIGIKVDGEQRILSSAMARNGENAWIMLLERAGRRIAAKPR